jgi:hypothetical protein
VRQSWTTNEFINYKSFYVRFAIHIRDSLRD